MSVEPAEDIFAAPTKEPAGPPQAATPAVARASDLAGALVLKHANLYLLTDAHGDITPEDGRGSGLYELDTRLLSRYELRLDGVRPRVLRSAAAAGYRGTITLASEAPAADAGLAVSITRERVIADGLRERVRLTSFATQPVELMLTLTVDADFADIFEVRGVRRAARGQRQPNRRRNGVVTLAYRGLDGVERGVRISTSGGFEVEAGMGGREAVRLAARVALEPGAARQLEVVIWPAAGGTAAPLIDDEGPAAAYRAWRQSSAQVSTPHVPTQRVLDRGMSDLRLLLNAGPQPGERYVAAGVPWYTTLFGRDSLIAALQLLPYRPQLARDTLLVLGRLQATALDEWRDAEPGRILHEWRDGEMARAGEVPHSPYYGSIDASPLWLMLLDEYERWTGDAELLRQLWPNALAALAWIDEHGDRDGDGFVEYQRRSRRGLANQGWKDSADGIVWPDGAPVEGPIALVEVQGYVFAARRGVARLARLLGDESRAAAQEAAADELRRRFDDAYWMDDLGTYALALDGAKRPIAAQTSNAGHALWTGIADPRRAAVVGRSLLGEGLWSGWGIRTLAAAGAAYNPMSYHRGSVWPHDNAICAAGLARYGMAAEAAQVGEALLEAAAHFREARLPELYCGFERQAGQLPVPYPVACSPQAWAAGAPFHVLTALLGLRPDAASGTLDVMAPVLPSLLGELTLANLRVGRGVVDLVFSRRGSGTAVEVVAHGGRLEVVVRH